MKQNIKYMILATILTAATMLSCEADVMLLPSIDDATFQIKGADSLKTRVDLKADTPQLTGLFANDELTFTTAVVSQYPYKVHPVNRGVDVRNLRNPRLDNRENDELIYKAIGGSLTAGVRDGGYFNEGIETSFAAILARQLGISNFKQPLFKAENYNGFGRKVLSDFSPIGGPFQKYALSNNNIAVQPSGSAAFKLNEKLEGRFLDYDNLGLLGGAAMNDMHMHNREETDIRYERYQDWGKSTANATGWFGYNDVLSKLVKVQGDIVSLEFISEFFDLYSFGKGKRISSAGILNYYRAPERKHPLDYLIENLKKNESKLILFNVPNVEKTPITNALSDESLKEYFKVITSLKSVGTFGPLARSEEEFASLATVKPTIGNDSLLSDKVHFLLKSKYQTTYGKKEDIGKLTISVNEYIQEFADRHEVPIVDLYSLFEEINKASYYTHDGILVDSSVDGNLYSSDGLYPTAFGHAIIANECIRTLNKYYKLNVPLVPTQVYLKENNKL